MKNCIVLVKDKYKARYHVLKRNGRSLLAHRYFYELKNGKIPKGKLICHKCDNKLCVNVNHMFLGTQKDNIQDVVKKGRMAYGEKNCNAKLNREDVLNIRKIYKKGTLNQRELGIKFGIARSNINKIIKGKLWPNV